VQEHERVAERGAHRVDLRALRQQGIARDSRERAFGVVGDREHAAPARARRGDHLLERGAPIARERRVNVEVADHVADRCGQHPVLGEVDLADVLAPTTGGIHGSPSAA
jgi:hypothetical protein